MGAGWLSAVATEDRERVRTHARRAVAQGDASYDKFRFEHTNARTVHVVSVGRAEFDDAGQVCGYIGTLTDVSALEQATASLRQSENRLQTFMDSNPAIVWIKDQCGRYVYMNRAWEAAFDLAAADIIGSTAEALVGAEEARRIAAIDAEVIARGATNGTVEDFIDVDGRRHVWDTVRFPFSTADGMPCIGGVAIDRSDRQRAEETLRELQERLNLATAAGNIGLWNGTCASAARSIPPNASASSASPTTRSATPMPNGGPVHPADLPRTKRRLREAVRHPDVPYVCEQRMLHKDGRYRWILAHGRMQTTADGRPLRLLGAHTDITAVKEAEQALVASQARLGHLLSANPSVLYLLRVTDEGFVPEWISDSVSRLLGYTTIEALAPDWWMSHIHPADRDRCLADSANIARHEHFVHEYRFLHRNGDVLVVRDEMRVLRDADGVPCEVVGSWSDITSASAAQARMRLFGTAFESTQRPSSSPIRTAPSFRSTAPPVTSPATRTRNWSDATRACCVQTDTIAPTSTRCGRNSRATITGRARSGIAARTARSIPSSPPSASSATRPDGSSTNSRSAPTSADSSRPSTNCTASPTTTRSPHCPIGCWSCRVSNTLSPTRSATASASA